VFKPNTLVLNFHKNSRILIGKLGLDHNTLIDSIVFSTGTGKFTNLKNVLTVVITDHFILEFLTVVIHDLKGLEPFLNRPKNH
jgi:hypothetical protein